MTAFITSREMYWKISTGTAPVAKNRGELFPIGTGMCWNV